jgi:hypothetical protein
MRNDTGQSATQCAVINIVYFAQSKGEELLPLRSIVKSKITQEYGNDIFYL